MVPVSQCTREKPASREFVPRPLPYSGMTAVDAQPIGGDHPCMLVPHGLNSRPIVGKRRSQNVLVESDPMKRSAQPPPSTIQQGSVDA